MSELAEFSTRLARVIAARFGPPGEVTNLVRLTGGATKATWSFDARVGDENLPLILQQPVARALRPDDPMNRLPHVAGAADAALMMAAARAGVPVPRVRLVLAPEDGLGAGYLTERIEGETLGARINRDERFARARSLMAAQCGEILAAIHAIAPGALPFLIEQDAAAELEVYRAIWDSFDHPQPAIELGFCWVAERAPKPARRSVVHGDFRNGNFIVGPQGIRAVLDWEIAHVGDPMADLGWLCVRTWRFGGRAPVGGFGRREDLFAAYERAGGGKVDAERVSFWEAFGCLKWSVMCMMKGQSHRRGGERLLEQLAIGRRSEEPLHDFLALLEERD
jgi:aminoglycoside phosphotransferase (APT) family kinase protein